MNNQWLTIRQLDKQLKAWQQLYQKYGKPRAGWIKTLRTALNMSAEQLANRLGLTRGRINQLENAEIHDTVTLRTLKEAANALDCEFIYAIIPKHHSTLEDIIKARAEEIAQEKVTRLAHSMSLEAQSVNTEELNIQKEELAKKIMLSLNRKFWEPSSYFDYLAEALSKYSQKNKNYLDEKEEPEYAKKLRKALMQLQNEKVIYETDLTNKLNQPEYINALKKALHRYYLKKK